MVPAAFATCLDVRRRQERAPCAERPELRIDVPAWSESSFKDSSSATCASQASARQRAKLGVPDESIAYASHVWQELQTVQFKAQDWYRTCRRGRCLAGLLWHWSLSLADLRHWKQPCVLIPDHYHFCGVLGHQVRRAGAVVAEAADHDQVVGVYALQVGGHVIQPPLHCIP